MNPSDTLRLQALKLKKLHSRGSSLPDEVVDDMLEKAVSQNPDQKEVRNICALIGAPLFAEVEGLASMLELSKRSIVEMALIEFMAKAGDIVNEVNPLGEVA
jgi:hypothetical protein